mgnify:CR=1 FL=1
MLIVFEMYPFPQHGYFGVGVAHRADASFYGLPLGIHSIIVIVAW